MTRWLRFVLTVLRSTRGARIRLDQESELRFRVWPSDADLTLMNHAAYLTIMEQGRVDFIARSGFMRFLVRRHWSAVLGSMTVQYRSPLRRFEKAVLRSRVVCWDEKWIFFEHRITRGTELVAAALARIAILGPGGRIRPADALSEFGLVTGSPPVAGMIEPLREGERLLHEHARTWPALDWIPDGRDPGLTSPT